MCSHLMRMCVVVVALAAAAAAAAIYVSPRGSDSSGDGSIGKPFATVGRAQQAVRLINAGMKEDIFVYLREGLYFVNQPIAFAQADSGFNGYTVHYASYPGETATIHSGVRVVGFKPVPGTSMWVAPLPDGIADSRQAYINGDRMIPTDMLGGLPGTVTITDTGYLVNTTITPFFAPGQYQGDIEFLYTGVGSSWTECRVRVASAVEKDGVTNITMQQPAYSLARHKFYSQGVSSPASIANLIALLGPSTPGRYYLNSRSHQLYYVPRPQDNMQTAVVMVPSQDVLVLAQGRSSKAGVDPVRFLAFERLTFAYAGWLEPNRGLGYSDMQSAFRVLPESTPDDSTWVPVPGNLQFHTVENITLINNTFTHLGATALVVDDSSQSVAILNNTFRDVSCGGLYLGQVNDINQTDPSRENGHFSVVNNLFDGIPVEFHDCAALLGGFVVDTNFTHNTILNSANTAISLGWGWSRDEAQNSGWNHIDYNYVYGSNWLLQDGGSVYVLGPQPQSVMSNNYISNQKKLFGALYTDEGSAYWHITLNVVNNCPEWLHIWTSTIHDERVDFCWTNQRYMQNAGTNCTVTNITYLNASDPFPPAAQDVINAAGVDWMAGPKP